MIIKTKAIVLHISPYSETSRIVSWMTEDYGKITTIIKGAQRVKSGFIGQYDFFYTCELLFYFKNYHGLHIVKECSPLNPRLAMRSQWRSSACASYFSDLVLKTAPVHAMSPELYGWLESALDVFGSLTPAMATLFWFELRMLDLMGLSPQLGVCVKCRRVPDSRVTSGNRASRSIESGWIPKDSRCFFSCVKGGVCCSRCAAEVADAMPIAPDILGLLRFWQSSPAWRPAQSSRCTGRQADTALNLLGQLMRYHLAVPLDSRVIAFNLLAMQPPLRKTISHRGREATVA